tara:strand:- start:314 stop:910 length:597 start_codon:yes stop_codon:yes gene_type:complete
MKISASIQAANQLNIIEDINNNNSKFDQIHVDITDGHFTNNISMSFQHIKEVKNQTNYKVDVQLMVENNVKLAPLAFEHGADLVCIHCESTDLNDFIRLSNQHSNLGVATLPDTSNKVISEYIQYSDAVLLLGVNPGFSNQGQSINLLDKVKDFNKLYPDFNGQLIADGGIKINDLENLKKNKVDIAVQGGAIFRSDA